MSSPAFSPPHASIHWLSSCSIPRRLRARFPQFRVPNDFCGVLERDSGFLYVEECVRAHLDEARKLGASIQAEERVTDWTSDGRSVTVTTTRGTYRASSLVLTAGPWAGQLLSAFGAPLRVMRQTMLWFGTEDDSRFRRDVFPIFLADGPEGPFYGLPVIDDRGLKVARHYGAPELVDPDEIERSVQPTDEPPVRQFLEKYLPAVIGPLRYAQTCIYTLTPDRHFVIDLHPEYRNVAVAAGFSGHGFKFSSVVGEVLADLAESGRTAWPIGMFAFKRLIA